MTESAAPAYRLTQQRISESALLEECAVACRNHPMVAGVKRVNGGGTETAYGGWVWFYRLWIDGKRRPVTSGWPDLEIWMKTGAVWLVEVKAPGEELKPAQRMVRDWAKYHGIRHFVVDGHRAMGGLLEALGNG